MTTVAYVGNKNYILNTNHLLDGKFNFIVVPDERAIDIDSQLDFELAELLLSKRK
jgi:N-acylneuraminate cytidylyltransferase